MSDETNAVETEATEPFAAPEASEVEADDSAEQAEASEGDDVSGDE